MGTLGKKIQLLKIDTLKSEEDIRFKLLKPYLESLGFNPSEIELEKTLSLRLGKSVNQVKPNLIQGRLDILCKRREQNLFVIELKRPDLEITSADISQGISYAVLLENNVAPFTLITNGKETKIFDSISRTEITGTKISEESNYWKDGLTIGGEDLLIRFEALKNFISYSEHNLKEFCKHQVETRMENVASDTIDEEAKYIRSLYLERKGVQESFSDFLKSDKSFFAIIGDSGVGKSNTICSLAEHYVNEEFVLFYNGSVVQDSPIELICRDLNLVFSETETTDKVLLRLNDLGSSLGKKIIVFIDSLDEYLIKNINVELSEIALASRHLPNIKFCITCKTTLWDQILYINNTKSHLFNSVYTNDEDENVNLKGNPGFLLKDFTKEELEVLIEKYRKLYKFKGEVSQSIKASIKNGFLLKVFSEVYREKTAPSSLDNLFLIETFLELKLKSISGLKIENTLRLLAKIGESFVEESKQSDSYYRYRFGVNINSVYEKLDLPIDQDIPEELFTYNLLIKNSTRLNTRISFYYSSIRDYIIAFKTFRLDKLSKGDFEETIKSLFDSDFGYSAVYFYSKNTTNVEHISVLNEYQRLKFLSYVELYDSYLDKNFSKIKRLFKPNTDNEIGIIIPPKRQLLNGGYALYPSGDLGLPKLIESKGVASILSDKEEDVFRKYNAKTIHASNSDLLVKNLDIKVERDIYKQLEKIIEDKKLDESKCEVLLKEKVAHLVYFKQVELGLTSGRNDLRFPRFNDFYPIDLKELHTKIEDDFRFRILKETISSLLKLNVSTLVSHYLPTPDIPISDINSEIQKRNLKDDWIPDLIEAQFSKERIKEYVVKFFQLVDEGYKSLVEHCFTEKKSEFLHYSETPHEFHVHFSPKKELRISSVTLGKSQTGQTEVYISNKSMVEFREEYPLPNHFSYTYGTSFSNITWDFHGRNLIKEIGDYLTIRNWVYRLLSTDFKQFKERLKID